MLYLAKAEKFKEIKNIKQIDIAREVGIAEATLSRIINKKQICSKTTAYCITKVINSEAEIEDYFEKKEG